MRPVICKPAVELSSLFVGQGEHIGIGVRLVGDAIPERLRQSDTLGDR